MDATKRVQHERLKVHALRFAGCFVPPLLLRLCAGKHAPRRSRLPPHTCWHTMHYCEVHGQIPPVVPTLEQDVSWPLLRAWGDGDLAFMWYARLGQHLADE